MADRTWKGNPRLDPLLVAVDEIQTHPRNPRRGDLPMLAESLEAFGQTRPIVVQPETGYIVAGNHTYRAATEILAWTHIAIIRPQLKPAEYEQFLLMDNRASDMSEYDDEALAPILKRLQERGELDHTGWNDAEIEDFIAGSYRLAHEADREFRAGLADEEGPAPGGRVFKKQGSGNQLMLAYSADAYQEVVSNLAILRREYGTEDISATTARALGNQFDLIFRGADE